MATKPNATKLYDNLEDLREMINEATNFANEIANQAEPFGGEIARVITAQIRQSMVPQLTTLASDAANPASAASLISFLSAAPLAWTRQGQGPGAEPPAQAGVGSGAPNLGQMPQQNPTAPAPGGDEGGMSSDSSLHESIEAAFEGGGEDWIGKTVIAEDGRTGVIVDGAGNSEGGWDYDVALDDGDDETFHDYELALYSDDDEAPIQEARSAIVQTKKTTSIREALQTYEEEVDFGDALDFKKMSETYKKPKTGVSATREPSYGEDRIFSQYLEKSAKPEDIKRLDEDILGGAYKMPTQEEVHSMDNWRTMVEDSPLDGARADDVADILMREGSGAAPAAPAAPTTRVREAAPSVQPMDGDVMADILNFNGDLA